MLISIVLLSTKSMATTAIVNTDTLKLRKEASTESDILGLLNLGEKLKVIEESGDWYKVSINNKTGYVHKDYIKIEEDTSEEQTNNNEVQENTNTEENAQTNTTLEENTVTNQENTTTQENSTTTENVAQQENIESNVNKKEYEPKETKLQKDTKCYILPLINSNILVDMKKETNITIINEVSGWLYIETEEVSGWIIANSVDLASLEQSGEEEEPAQEQTQTTTTNNTETTGENQTNPQEGSEIKVTAIKEKDMYVNTASIYMRKGPGTNYEVVDSLILNSGVVVTGEVEDWYQVKVDGKIGYIAKRLLSNTKTEDTTTRGAEERANQTPNTQEVTQTSQSPATLATSKGEEIVNYAKQYLGCKYVYGGSGPSTFDCSGFTMYVYKHFGVSLSHSATAQSKNGSYVAKENLQPGDLVFFKDYQTMDGIGHCGIYIGDGNFIHASSGTGYCVKISTLLSGSYNKRYCAARRII